MEDLSEEVFCFITCVSFSGDDKYLVSSSYDGIVKIWDVANKLLIKEFNNIDQVNCVQFSPDNKLIACNSDYKINLWEIESNSLLKTLIDEDDNTKMIFMLSFSPDGTLIASCSGNKIIVLWDVIKGTKVLTIDNFETENITCMVFSPNSQYLATSLSDCTILLWNYHTGEKVKTFEHDDDINCIAFSQDSVFIACGSENNVKIWNIQNETVKDEFYHIKDPRNLVFSFDGNSILIGCKDNIFLWVFDPFQIHEIKYKFYDINSIAVNSTGILAVGGVCDSIVNSKGVVRCKYEDIVLLDLKDSNTMKYFVSDQLLIELLNFYNENKIRSNNIDNFANNINSDTKCTICLDPMFYEQKELSILPCNHCFHRECLSDWLNRVESCPICRRV